MKGVSVRGVIAFTFGAAEVMKQGFAESGNCWWMALGVLTLVYGVLKVWKTS